MQLGRAHGVSLPLYSLLNPRGDESTSAVCLRVRDGLRAMRIEGDVDIVLIIQEGKTSLFVEATSSFGELIVKELAARVDFPPCPDGTCEYDAQGACKWCGTIPRQ